MKLSIGMIAEVLDDLEPFCEFRQFDRQLNLEHCMFYDGDYRLHADTVYLFTEELMEKNPPVSLTTEAGAAVICLGDRENFRISPQAAFICISPEKISAANLSNRVQRCFERYRKIDAALREAVQGPDDMMELTRLATPLFQNEITVRDSAFRYVAHSYKRIRFSTLYGGEHADTYDITPTEEVDSLKHDAHYHEQISTQKPWFYQYGDYQMWCYDIFFHHIFVYRVKLVDTNQRFRPWDQELLHYFCQMILKKLTDLPVHDQEHDFAQLIRSLLESAEVPDHREMDIILKKRGWSFGDRYLFLCLSSGKSNGKLNPIQYYCAFFRKKFPFTFAVQEKRNILLLVNLTKGYHDSEREFLGQVSEVLRDENFRAGISFSYTPLTQTVYAHRQAAIALQKGIMLDPEIWTYPFKKYRYQYLLGLIYETFPDYFYILPELRLLELYDKENNTSFVETLKCYLSCDRNMLQTAKTLNMHRSTLAYQLKKIGKIMDANLNEPDLDALLRFVLQGLDL